jgi:transcriptional regulator
LLFILSCGRNFFFYYLRQMYNLPHYKEKDSAVVIEYMKQHPFATLMGVSADQKPVATQIPLLFSEKDGYICLRGHIMKGNDHHKAFENNKNVLVLFTGPHTFVSASWYENKLQGGTWNYITVQAHGELSFMSEEEMLVLLEDLTTHFENNPASPSRYKNLPEEYISRLKKAIIGIEIKITSLEHVFKLSQNRDQKSYENIIEKLENSNADAKAIAEEMRKRKDQFFPV